MTQKELLYMEDAVGHETNLISICEYTIEALQDKNLQTFMKAQAKKHKNLKEKLIKVLEESINE